MRRGITPVVAIVLLLMLTVATAGSAYVWVTGTIQQGQEDTTASLNTALDIKDVQCSGGEVRVAIKNDGSRAFSDRSMKAFLYREDTLAGNATVDITGASFRDPSGISTLTFNITGTTLGGRTHTLELDIGDYTTRATCESGGAASCESILSAGAASTSGEYRIDPDGVDGTGAFTAYCEMDPQTDEAVTDAVDQVYTFKVVRNGISTSTRTDPNSCQNMGLMLWAPQGPGEYDVAVNYIVDDYGLPTAQWAGGDHAGPLGPLGIYAPVNGDNNGGPNFDAEESRDLYSEHFNESGYSGFPVNDALGADNLYGQGTDGWTTIATGDQFFVESSDTQDSEPNGNYIAGSWLNFPFGGSWNSEGRPTGYDDNDASNSYDDYLCVHPNYQNGQ